MMLRDDDVSDKNQVEKSRRYSDLRVPAHPPGLSMHNKRLRSPAPSSLESLVTDTFRDRVGAPPPPPGGNDSNVQGISLPEYNFLVKRVMNLRKRLVQRVKKADVTLRTLYGEAIPEDTYKTKANCRAIANMIRKCSMVLGMSARRFRRLDKQIKARCNNLQILLSVLSVSTVNLRQDPRKDPHYEKMISDNPITASIDFHRARLKFLHDAVNDAKREALKPLTMQVTKETLADNVVDAENQAEDASDRLLKQYVQFRDAIRSVVVPDKVSRSKMPFATRKSSLDDVLLRMLSTKYEMQGRTVHTLERWSKLHERFELLRQDANKLEEEGKKRIEELKRPPPPPPVVEIDDLKEDDQLELEKRRAAEMFSRAQRRIELDVQRRRKIREEQQQQMEREMKKEREIELEEADRFSRTQRRMETDNGVIEERKTREIEERKTREIEERKTRVIEEKKTIRRPPPPASPFDSELENKKQEIENKKQEIDEMETLFDCVLKAILKTSGRMLTASIRKIKGLLEKECDENGTIDASSFDDCIRNKTSVVLSYAQIRDIFKILGPDRISVEIFVKHVKDAFKRKSMKAKRNKNRVKEKKIARPRMVFSTSTSDTRVVDRPLPRKNKDTIPVMTTKKSVRPPPPTTTPPPRWMESSSSESTMNRTSTSIGKWISSHRMDFIKSFEEAHKDLLG